VSVVSEGRHAGGPERLSRRPQCGSADGIAEQGARVFLESHTAELLDEKVLDASVDQNDVTFSITDQIDE
jgi:hypothetical protein